MAGSLLEVMLNSYELVMKPNNAFCGMVQDWPVSGRLAKVDVTSRVKVGDRGGRAVEGGGSGSGCGDECAYFNDRRLK